MGRRSKKLIRKKTYWSAYPLYVIATEGEVTEKIYFSGVFGRKNIRMPVLNTKKGNSSPDRVLKRLNQYRRENNASPNELWLVIDRDSWKQETLEKIAKECRAKGYNLLISNPCFELWLLLHQEKPKNPSLGKDCEKELKKLIPDYTKSKYKLCDIRDNLEFAIKNAKRLDKNIDIQDPPSTKVYKLVEKLITEN